MDLENGKIKPLFFKYLLFSFGSALITSIYSIVDTAMVGQYHGPNGSAALTVVAPVWNLIYSLGLLVGIVGSVFFSLKKGVGKEEREGNEYFTVAVILSIILSLLSWIGLLLFKQQIFVFFGADETLLDMALNYIRPIQYVFPLFLFNQMLPAFLRNDNDPSLATIGVISGGVFNILGDFIFVFVCDMGIFGAGLATAIASCISFFIMLTHFLRKKNTLSFVKVHKPLKRASEILVTGFPTFFIDASMGILTILFNRQIMKYLGSEALAIYSPIIQVSTFVQCCAYSIGQAAQPIISTNFGAKKERRIHEILHLSLWVCLFFGLCFTAFSMAFPNAYIDLFMTPTDEILTLAPSIIRTYSLSFLILPFNIFSTYYFQAIMKPKAAFIVSVMRGILISSILIFLLPIIKPRLLWLTMPITEASVMIYAVLAIRKFNKKLQEENPEVSK